MTYRDGWWHCDGEDCDQRRRDLPPEWYATQVDGSLSTYCVECLEALYHRLQRERGRIV